MPEDPEKLKSHSEVIVNLLRIAARSSRVYIVTMATRDWIDICMQKLLPGMPDHLAELGIEIVLARRQSRKAFADCRNPSQWMKVQAMTKIVRGFYRRPSVTSEDSAASCCRKRSWKNVMGIGDQPADRLALEDVIFRHQQRDRKGRWKECRCKTLTLLNSPSLEELTQELRVVTAWLPTLLQHDGDLQLELDGADMTLTGEGLPPDPPDLQRCSSEAMPAAMCAEPLLGG
jgi:hypothetical protein